MATATTGTPAGATVARSAVAKLKGGGEAVASTARSTPGPVRAAGFAAAGLAGGLALGSHVAARRQPLRFLSHPRRTVLGIPIGREPTAVAAARALVDSTRRLADAGKHVSRTAEDIHELRRHLEQANRQSPIEVLLNALTHRRGAHRAEH
jgi:hypothetical protein